MGDRVALCVLFMSALCRGIQVTARAMMRRTRSSATMLLGAVILTVQLLGGAVGDVGESGLLQKSGRSLPSGALVRRRLPTQRAEKRVGKAVRGGGKPVPQPERRIPLALPMLAAFLYNLSIGFTIPILPKIINTLINGDPKVSPKSAAYYGYTTSVDQLMTFLLVNGACSLSDRYGRRPFMALANMGLGTGQVIAALSRRPEWLLLGAFVDGCTSYSYPLAQAYIADITEPSKLMVAYGTFQGIATGAAFLLGIPISGIIAAKTGNLRIPLYISASICALNLLYITLLLPESLPPARRRQTAPIQDANAVGAFKMVARTPFIGLLSTVYFLLHLALNGLQINAINYLQYTMNWGVAQSSGALCVVFLFTAVFPRILLPLLGLRKAMSWCSLIFAGGLTMLGVSRQTWSVLTSLILIAMGTSALPATLALLTTQVPASEKGAMNGAADTVRTLSTTLGFPLMTNIFAWGISDKLQVKIPGAALFLSAGLLVLSNLFLQVALLQPHETMGDDFMARSRK